MSEVLRNRFPSKVPKVPKVPGKRFPGRGSEARFPTKVPRNKFPRFPKVSKNRFRSKVPKSRF